MIVADAAALGSRYEEALQAVSLAARQGISLYCVKEGLRIDALFPQTPAIASPMFAPVSSPHGTRPYASANARIFSLSASSRPFLTNANSIARHSP